MSVQEKIISELHSYAGDIFKELTLPVKGSAVSPAFRGSAATPGVRITAAALTGFRLKDREKITFELLESDTWKGPFFNREIISVVSGPITFFAGDEIMSYVPGTGLKRYLKLKVSDNADLSAVAITAYLVRKG